MSIVEMRVPTIGESINEVTLSQWLKKDGDIVNLDDPICEFESDKATLEFPAEAAGKLTYVASEGDDLEIGALVAKIDTSVTANGSNGSAPTTPAAKKEEEKATPPPPSPISTPPPVPSYASGHPSPAAAKILKENAVATTEVRGTGVDGRITKEDALQAVVNKPSAPMPSVETKTATPPPTLTPTANFSRNTSRKKMSRMRRTIATRLVSAKNNTAMLTTFNEVDLTEVMNLRKKYQDDFVTKYGIKLGFMSLFAKACAKVLMEMPEVNAQLDENEIVYHDYADISIAISTPTGLVVPPVHNAESLKFHEIEIKIKELAGKARDNKLTLDEMKGGTFTITNGGVFGSMMSTPILNEPQSAILGMHTIQQRPMAINGEVKIRPMMYLALSYDHRVIDGSASVTFLVKVKNLLEDPVKLLLDI
ncbi:MAG: 2-oxoglutarate dehydrogenase E2 component (dihydrolipoamide succinyltransferase) [Saprospiraceae bacterium]|jgi:2-oxoglutarate dehydrogenase E2 component (dihydrolipoamide succinyltransferase)